MPSMWSGAELDPLHFVKYMPLSAHVTDAEGDVLSRAALFRKHRSHGKSCCVSFPAGVLQVQEHGGQRLPQRLHRAQRQALGHPQGHHGLHCPPDPAAAELQGEAPGVLQGRLDVRACDIFGGLAGEVAVREGEQNRGGENVPSSEPSSGWTVRLVDTYLDDVNLQLRSKNMVLVCPWPASPLKCRLTSEVTDACAFK